VTTPTLPVSTVVVKKSRTMIPAKRARPRIKAPARYLEFMPQRIADLGGK
jgi:hypothetical protein